MADISFDDVTVYFIQTSEINIKKQIIHTVVMISIGLVISLGISQSPFSLMRQTNHNKDAQNFA